MATDDAGERAYVLIQGAWHGGWVWKDVARRPRAIGHDVYAPSLMELGDRRHQLRPDMTLDTHADDIVLVGWSYGGMVTSVVLARIPDRIASVV